MSILQKAVTALFAAAIVALTLFGLSYGLAGDSVGVALSRSAFYTNERVVLTIIVKTGASAEVTMPEGREVLKDLTVLKESTVESVLLWRKKCRKTIAFTVEKAGDYTVPSSAVTCNDGSPARRTLMTPPVPFTVKTLAELNDTNVYTTRIGGGMGSGKGTVTGGDNSFRAIDGEIRLKIKDETKPFGIVDRKKVMIWSGCAALIGVLAIVTTLIVRKMPKKVRVIPPGEAARTRLAELEKKAQGGCDAKESSYELSAILKSYLRSVLGITEEGLTMTELFTAIDKSDLIESTKKEAFKELFTRCDEIKYSALPSSDAASMLERIATARTLIEGIERTATAKDGA